MLCLAVAGAAAGAARAVSCVPRPTILRRCLMWRRAYCERLRKIFDSVTLSRSVRTHLTPHHVRSLVGKAKTTLDRPLAGPTDVTHTDSGQRGAGASGAGSRRCVCVSAGCPAAPHTPQPRTAHIDHRALSLSSHVHRSSYGVSLSAPHCAPTAYSIPARTRRSDRGSQLVDPRANGAADVRPRLCVAHEDAVARGDACDR